MKITVTFESERDRSENLDLVNDLIKRIAAAKMLGLRFNGLGLLKVLARAMGDDRDEPVPLEPRATGAVPVPMDLLRSIAEDLDLRASDFMVRGDLENARRTGERCRALHTILASLSAQPAPAATDRGEVTEALVTFESASAQLRTMYEPSCQGHIPSAYGWDLSQKFDKALDTLRAALGIGGVK